MARGAGGDAAGRAAKIAEYERFIGERLQPDLLAAEEGRAKVQASIDTWEGLITNVRGVQEQGSDQLRTLVDLGSQVYCQAEVPDTSRIFVSVGLGFHAEMTLVRSPRVSVRLERRDARRRKGRSEKCGRGARPGTRVRGRHRGSDHLSVPFPPLLRPRLTGRGGGVRGEEARASQG